MNFYIYYLVQLRNKHLNILNSIRLSQVTPDDLKLNKFPLNQLDKFDNWFLLFYDNTPYWFGDFDFPEIAKNITDLLDKNGDD